MKCLVQFLFLFVVLLIENSLALDRTIIRQEILLHHISQSVGRIDPFYSNEIVKRRFRRQAFPSDDEDFDGSGEIDKDTNLVVEATENPLVPEQPRASPSDWIWYRTKINFMDSIEYHADLTDYHTEAFAELAHEIMTDVEQYLRTQLDGYHEATPLMFSKPENDVIVLIDVGLCASHSINDVTRVLTSMVAGGELGRFTLSEEGFSIRQIGVDPERQECAPGPTLPSTTVSTYSESNSTSTESPSEVPSRDVDNGTSSSETPTCRLDQATCRNRQCIDRSYVCDGAADCLDGSDEPESCGTTADQCDPTEFLCIGTGVCAQKIWRCDGDDDCGNGFDESNCPAASPGARCETSQFECRNRVCIPNSFQCDGEEDCDDASDEEGCSAPVVITPPQHLVNAVEGETVTLECEAIGVPNPIISWRVNWDNVPPPPRVTMTSANGKGVLTIRKVKLSDQGAYTCEAINPNGSILGTPDAIVTVEENTEPTPEPTHPYEPAGGPELDEGRCEPEEFDSSSNFTSECKPCYCSNVSSECTSSKLEFSKIAIEFTQPDNQQGVALEPTDIDGDPKTPSPITKNQIDVNPPARELQLIDLSKRFLAAAHYWSLPAQFLGAKINSYGGTLTFSFSYNNSYHTQSSPTNYTDVIVEGNGRKLYYKSEGPHPEPSISHQAEVLLEEDKFKTPEGEPVTRQEMLDVLGRLDRILIRTVYDNSMLSTGIGDVKLLVAELPTSREDKVGTEPAGVIAYAVEECVCPTGYEGLSCETCSPGFERIESGPLAGKCWSDEQQDSPPGLVCDVGYRGANCEECAEGYTPYEGGCTRYPDTQCNVAGSIGINLGRPCECKPGCQGPQCGECKPGFYFLSDENPDGCLECFCMGVSATCNSTKWNITTIQPNFRDGNSFVLMTAESGDTFKENIRFNEALDAGRQPEISAQVGRLPNDIYYWALPEEFTGNKLSSYGGKLDYTIRYSVRGDGRPISGIANTKLIGNGVTLEYVSDVHPEVDTNTRYVVEIVEKYWLTSSGTPASREELMIVLSNVEDFLVRASYSSDMQITTIKNIYLDTAVPRRTGGPVAYKVEQCSCPPGYSGLSCEMCSPGYRRVDTGSFLGECQQCECNGHSNDCDSYGVCRNCLHDTYGDHCEVCDDGFYGDATTGRISDCQICPCPAVEGRTDQGRAATCHVNANGNPVCDRCPQGYDGDTCQRCAPGYIGDPLIPGSTCRREDNVCECDPVGAVDGSCDSFGQCTCKPSTSGRKCDQCKAGFFYLSIENIDEGCLPCFCMGLTKQCTSATYKRNEVTSDFASDYGGFVLTQRERQAEISDGFELLYQGRSLSYPRMDTLPRGGAYYWQLPEEYRGNKIVSYGGTLRYKASFTAYAISSPNSDPDVVVMGNDITIVSTISDRNSEVRPNAVMDRSVVFRENYWNRADGQPATREDLLIALADVEAVLIRATYSPTMLRSTVSDVAMETASESVLMSEPAYEVEQCECPNGYDGLSCEDCAAGFTRSASGIYLGLCHLCQCNGHADLCDTESGVCVNCRDNTIGDQCDQCAPGYYGDATQGTGNDCRPCACPGTGENSFSETCRLQASSNALVCTACQEGYAGQGCERCSPGFEGNPSAPGGVCRRIADSSTIGILPEVTVSPKTVNAQRYSSVAIRCSVNSPTAVAVIWRRGESTMEPLPRGAIISNRGRKLTFPRFTSAQAGTYKCMARNNFGSDSDTTVITLASEKPMIKVRVEEPRNVRVRIGSEVSFVCTATSKMPAFIVSWTKQNGMLPLSRVTDFDGILHISNVQVSDSGTYVCTGSNMYSIDQEAATLLVVEGNEGIRPTAEVTPKNQSVSEGEDAMFYCTTRGQPAPNVEWRRADGLPMPDGAHVVGNMLMIPSASIDDRSLYYCRASNPHGISESTGALDVEERGLPPSVQVLTPEVTLTVGDDSDLECRAIGDPKPVFSWSKRGPGLPPNVNASKGTLRLTSATLANQGIYECIADNLFGRDSGFIRVTVNRKSSHEGKPICRTEPKEVTTYVGTNSTITCVVGGDPRPSVTWETDDGSPLDDNIEIREEKMFIYNVRRGNAGKYVCVATNRNGVSRSKMTVHVVKKDLPRVAITPRRRQKVRAGQDASFTCLAPGQLDADITWLRSDRKPFTGDTHLSNGNSKLNFRNISTNEAGSYLCVASNVVGHKEASVYIYVVQPPIITVKPARSIDLTEGESIDLECKVTGVPIPSAVWLNATGGGSPRMLTNYRLRSNFYSIRNARLSDAGEYYCRATNEGGNNQVKVTLMVRQLVVPVPPSASVDQSLVSSVGGSPIRIRCSATGYPTPSLTWSKTGRELPEGSSQNDGTLFIPESRDIDGGTYVCTATNQLGQDTANVEVNVIVPPLLEIRPSPKILLVPGESSNISCTAIQGSQPISYTWSKDSDPRFSPSSNNNLQIIDFTPDRDAGSYTCTATNQAGVSSTNFVIKQAEPPLVNALPRAMTKFVGQEAEFSCTVEANADSLDVAPRWERADGQSVDADRFTTSSGSLRIRNIQLSDATAYECIASNSAGLSSDSVTLTVQKPPQAKIYLPHDRTVFKEGEGFSLTCNGTGVPTPTVRLLKDDEDIEISVEGNYFVEVLSTSDAGVYICLATSDIGSSEVETTIAVHGIPKAQIENPEEEFLSGENLFLNCLVEGVPEPNITWTKENGIIPEDIVKDGQLSIEAASVSDTGVYICKASNEAGTNESEFNVYVHAFIPYFTQTPLSYMAVAIPDNKFYTMFNITVSFRPNVLDGLLFFSDSTNQDFISLSLSQGTVEFCYDVGSGPVTIRSRSTVERGRWHTVTVSRMERKGELRLDDDEVVKGKSPGEFRALELTSDLYVGGTPSSVSLPEQLESLGSDSGFYGCISQLKIGTNFIDLGSSEEVKERFEVVRCKACGSDDDKSLCENQSKCVESHDAATGHVCHCHTGYIGETCQFKEDQLCQEDACGSHGTCHVDLERQLGYSCECDEGYIGSLCQNKVTTTTISMAVAPVTSIVLSDLFARGGGELIRPAGLLTRRKDEELPVHVLAPQETHAFLPSSTTRSPPDTSTQKYSGAISFTQDSYLMSRTIRASQLRRTDITMRIRRRSHADGVLLFTGGTSRRSPFLSLSIRNNALEFRFNAGHDVTILRSPTSAIGVGSWHTIHATRRRGRGKLEVDGKNVARARSSGSDELNLSGALFIGGVKFWENIPDMINVRDGFDGCVESMRIDRVDVPFDDSFTKKNTGSCKIQPHALAESQTDDASDGVLKPRHSAKFTDSSYVAFDTNIFRHDEAAEQISLRFQTTEPYGLILFHGEDLVSELNAASRFRHKRQPSRRKPQNKDYISLGVQGSYLVYTFDLGGGQGKATSTFPVSDGVWHTVTIVRRGSLALMWMDDMPIPVATQSRGSHSQANTPGRLYIGGAPDVIFATAGRYTTGFNGCLKDVRLTSISTTRTSELGSSYLDDTTSLALDFSRSATLERINVRRCMTVPSGNLN